MNADLAAPAPLVGFTPTTFFLGLALGQLLGGPLVPESLPPERRHGGGLRPFAARLGEVIKIRVFTGYTLTASLSASRPAPAAVPATSPEDRRVTSAQSLLYAAASDVTIERVRALVRQVGQRTIPVVLLEPA